MIANNAMPTSHSTTEFLPVAALAPLEYRYALDAAMPQLAAAGAVAVRCHADELLGEVRQRLPQWAEPGMARAGVLVEPMVDAWQADIDWFALTLPNHAPLAIVASLPLARLVPERRAWFGKPLGTTTSGLRRLYHALDQAGFGQRRSYGVHSALSIALGVVSGRAARMGRPDIADRLHFAARLHYCTTGPFVRFATIALIIAQKVGG